MKSQNTKNVEFLMIEAFKYHEKQPLEVHIPV